MAISQVVGISFVFLEEFGYASFWHDIYCIVTPLRVSANDPELAHSPIPARPADNFL